jgi:hypothetical protein
LPGTERARSRRRPRSAAAVLLCGLLAVGLAVPAVAKKSKSKSPATTQSATVPIASGATATTSASCKGKSHVTGGGFAVSPPFTPPSGGLRSWTPASNPAGKKSWAASGSAFGNPSGTGTFTAFARCERNSLGRIAVSASTSVTLSPGEFRSIALVCPSNSHVLSGGYAGDGPTDLNHPSSNGWRLDILQSQRTSAREWTITAFDRGSTPPPSAPASLTGFVICELNSKGLKVSEKSAATPLASGARATADPSCPKGRHVVSAGFVISPLPSGVGSVVPVVSLDEFRPTSGRNWHVGLHPWTTAVLPAGESLQAFAYCKKDPK